MDTGMLHLHTTCVILFLLFFTFKVVVLLAGNYSLLDKVRAKTKPVEPILGTLILATGAYLLYRSGFGQLWLNVKVAASLVLIPLGIVGMVKKNKALAVLVLLGFVYVYMVAKHKSLSAGFAKKEYAVAPLEGSFENEVALGKTIYAAECERCHGPAGDAGLFGATNIKNTELSAEAVADIVTHGRKVMPAFQDKLSAEQVKAVSAYAVSLK